jgi:metacaspase-1
VNILRPLGGLTMCFFKSQPIDVDDVDTEAETEELEIIMPKKREKRALLVGIDRYEMPGSDLNGCVNDVEDVYDLLVNNYGFQPDNIRVLTDERATKQSIMERLQWMVNETEAGDESIYYHSGHGSQLRDRSGDELTDFKDECLITHDHDWDNPLIDDDIALFFKQKKEGAFLTMVCDTCHSGTMTRSFDEATPRFIVPPFDIESRSIGRKLTSKSIGSRSGEEESQGHVLLSGCKESQTSKEIRIGRQTRGVMTYNLTKNLRENNGLSWSEVHEIVVKAVEEFDQIPQLRGSGELKSRKSFGGNE